MLRTTTLATAATLAATALAACGGTPPSDEEAVRATTLGFLAELAEGDEHACERLTNDGRRQLDGRAELLGLDGCAGIVAAIAAEYSDADREAMRELRIRKITIAGDRATVRDHDFEIPAELDGQLAIDDRPTVLRRQGGVWKLEELG